jgi:hypothetical protein
MSRDMEREIIPMTREEGVVLQSFCICLFMLISFWTTWEGMAIAPWDVLGAGKIRTDEEEQRRRETGEKGRQGANWERTEEERKVCLALEEVAKQIGAKSIQAGTMLHFTCLITVLHCPC